MADRDNNPPYFPLSTQAQRIKEALQLDDERLWNALRVSILSLPTTFAWSCLFDADGGRYV